MREQLERILASHAFRNSKKYPALFRYVVEHALRGETTQLKERTLGVAVFGRDPDYDTSSDPIVRTTAGEIRKRIAQYYDDAQRENEIRIDVPPGSYAPEFRLPRRPWPAAAKGTTVASAVPWKSRRWPAYTMALVGALSILIALMVLKPAPTRTALDKFWNPVLASSSPVLLCISRGNVDGEADPSSDPGAEASPEVSVDQALAQDQVQFADAKTLARLSGFLASRAKKYSIRRVASTTFGDLREGPVVLIGAFNNKWTLRLTQPLRFGFESDREAKHYWIRDRAFPQRRWILTAGAAYGKLTEDYALISRVFDPTTGRIVVVAAGIFNCGTAAAGEFLTDPELMEQMTAGAPENWERRNIQIVIATKVVNGNTGVPRVLATHFW
ncbi:MAG TPA: hypothetical protein VEU11_01695 [Terriglobales bacterium]|nr:hypothetical protein [Terriglobales bacterium]